MGWKLGALGAVALFAAPPSFAQESADAVDPATIAVPELTSPAISDRGGFHIYFLYWKQDVGFVRARADLAECFAYRIEPAPRYYPYFAKLDDEPLAKSSPKPVTSNGYGLVGSVMGALLFGGVNFRSEQQRLRMCMGFKNYTRFGVSKALWEQVSKGDPVAAVNVQAKIAAGPRPELPEIQP